MRGCEVCVAAKEVVVACESDFFPSSADAVCEGQAGRTMAGGRGGVWRSRNSAKFRRESVLRLIRCPGVGGTGESVCRRREGCY